MEAEDGKGTYTFSFQKEEITFVEVKKKVKIRKIYTIPISLANGLTLTLESSKNPEIFFRYI